MREDESYFYKLLGRKIHERRTELGLSMKEIADSIEITYQQFNKYESGQNRISIWNLSKVSNIVEAPVMYFLPDLDGEKIPWSARDTLEFMRAYQKIKEPQRDVLRALVRSMGD